MGEAGVTVSFGPEFLHYSTPLATARDVAPRVLEWKGRPRCHEGSHISYSRHSTRAPRDCRFSTNLGCARWMGVALLMTDSPSMLAATMNSAIATRMM